MRQLIAEAKKVLNKGQAMPLRDWLVEYYGTKDFKEKIAPEVYEFIKPDLDEVMNGYQADNYPTGASFEFREECKKIAAKKFAELAIARRDPKNKKKEKLVLHGEKGFYFMTTWKGIATPKTIPDRDGRYKDPIEVFSYFLFLYHMTTFKPTSGVKFEFMTFDEVNEKFKAGINAATLVVAKKFNK